MRPIDSFMTARADDLDRLMRHFEENGQALVSVEALCIEMLDDVIDLWTETHLNNVCDCG